MEHRGRQRGGGTPAGRLRGKNEPERRTERQGVCGQPCSLRSLQQSHWEILGLKSSSVQSLSCVQLFATPGTAARQVTLSITISWSLPKPMSIESVMPSNHLILCRPLLPPSVFPSIGVFSNESALRIRGQSIGVSASSVLPMNTQD